MPVTLYQPEKYKVHQGRGGHIGFCTVWNEAEQIFKRSTVLQDKAAIVGTLYSRQGVNVILRNLALNPAIRELYVWGHGTLSNTQFGVAGRELLKAVWEKGVETDGTVRGTQFKLESEIDAGAINLIREKVKLIDLSDQEFAAVETIITAAAPETSAYMSAQTFPEHQLAAVETFPSEEVGWLVRGHGILDTWSRVIDRIMRYGLIKGTQYGYQQRELIGVTWVAEQEDPENPDLRLAADWPKTLIQTVGADEKSLREYYQVFLSPEAPAGLAYTYGNRLMSYPNGDGFIDQIADVIIKQLKSSPDARRTVATTMVPAIDWNSKEPPCLTQIQCLQTRGKLHLLATFRSHDLFKAGVPNAFGLRRLQLKIAGELGFELGKLQITSQSAHIYEQDWTEAEKLARCFYWERPPQMGFNPETQADPRGNLLISVSQNQIVATLSVPTGETLLKLEAASARILAKKIAQLGLLSRHDHLLDIGMELEKAELALQKKLTYTQDQPIKL